MSKLRMTRHRKSRLFCSCISLSAICILFLSSCKNETNKEQETSIPVITPQPLNQLTERKYTFISDPYRIVDLSFRINGPIDKFDAQNGKFYKKNELIAVIDQRDFILRYQHADAEYKQKRSEWQRIKKLYEKNNISATQYDKAEADYKLAQAAWQASKNALADTKLTAPFDGYVQQTYVERYEDIHATEPVVQFIDISRLKIEVYVPEDLIPIIKDYHQNPICSITFDALPQDSIFPSETFLTQSVTENNISYCFTAIINNPSYSLSGGMAGTLTFKIPLTSTSSVAIPLTAVCHNSQEGDYVWLLDSNKKPYKAKIRCGKLLSNGQIEITQGLTANDKVLMYGKN